jgi:hypothetical protein
MKTIIPFLFLTIFIISCGNEKNEVSITFIFDKPIRNTINYPSYFKDLTTPFVAQCDKETDFLLKPINISRLDISNKEIETNAWHFKDLGDNTVDFSKLWLEQYFKDSLINPYLTKPSAKEFLFDNWLENSRDSIYILSEESNLSEYRGRKIFTNTEELYEQIQASACNSKLTKILVVVNPTIHNNGKVSITDTKRINEDNPKLVRVKRTNSTEVNKTKSENIQNEVLLPRGRKEKWSGENTTQDEAKNNTISREDIKSK